MSERTSNGDLADRLARIETKLDNLVDTVGEKPTEGLRGEVTMLVGIKNKGWGIIVGLLILAGSAGAAIKTAVSDVLR
jgi:phage-related minor tail protein